MMRKVVLRISSDPAEINSARQSPGNCLKHGVLMPTCGDGDVSGLLCGKVRKMLEFFFVSAFKSDLRLGSNSD